jgi:hypothetical protein
MKNKLNEELLRQIELMKFDRSKILSEQENIFEQGSADLYIDRYAHQKAGIDYDNAKRETAQKTVNSISDFWDEVKRDLTISKGDRKWLYDRFVAPITPWFGPTFRKDLESLSITFPDLYKMYRGIEKGSAAINEWLREDSFVPMLVVNILAMFTPIGPAKLIFQGTAVALDILEVQAYMQPTKENPDGDLFMAGLLALFAVLNISDLIKLGYSTKEITLAREAFEKKTVKEANKNIVKKLLTDNRVSKMILKKVAYKSIIELLDKVKFMPLRGLLKFIVGCIRLGFLSSKFLLRTAFVLTKGLLKMVVTIGSIVVPWYVLCRYFDIPGTPKFGDIDKKEKKIKKEISNTTAIDLGETLIACVEANKKLNKNYLEKTENYDPFIELLEMYFEKFKVEPLESFLDPFGTYDPKTKLLIINRSEDIVKVNLYTILGRMLKQTTVYNQKTIKIDLKDLKEPDMSGIIIISATDNKNKRADSKIVPMVPSQITLDFSDEEYQPGIYGTYISAVIANIQKRNNLSVDGFIGDKTYDVLIKEFTKMPETIINVSNEFNKKLTDSYEEILKEKTEEDLDKVSDESQEYLDQLEKEYNRRKGQDSLYNEKMDSIKTQHMVLPDIDSTDYNSTIREFQNLLKNSEDKDNY